MKRHTPDPLEAMMREALEREGFSFTEDGKPGGEVNKGLDFYLIAYGIHIEVKRFHSERIADQMARAPNVIAVQGAEAVAFLATVLTDYQSTQPRRHQCRLNSQ